MENGREVSVMALVSNNGLMELNTLENGVKTELTERVNLSM